MRHCLAATLLGGLLLSAPCLADGPGTLIRACELKNQPFIDADTLASLPDSAPVTVLDNQGGWSRIKTADGKQGWVRLLNIRIGKPDEPAVVGKSLAQLGGVIRTGTTKSAATTGVKGLSKEEIRAAKPNPQEIRRLEAARAKPREVDQFAAARKLVAQDIPELNP